jgi:hypothetical protein
VVTDRRDADRRAAQAPARAPGEDGATHRRRPRVRQASSPSACTY